MSTYDDASLIYYPSGYKAGKAYSLKPTDGSGDLDFTRASAATRVNESGLIESVATGVPRIDFTGGGCGKLLLEPQRTNLITYSEDFTNVSWQKTSLTVTSAAATSPDGTTNADKLIPSVANDQHFIRTFPGLSVNTYTNTIFAKSAGYKYFVLYRIGFLIPTFFNLDTGVVDSVGGGVTATMEDFGNGWYKCEAVYTVAGGSVVDYLVSDTLGVTNYEGDGTSGIYVWGADLQLGSFPTSYIPTTTTAVTRTQDASVTTGLSSVINSVEGVAYFKLKAINNPTLTTLLITISDGSNNNNLTISYNATGRLDANLKVGGAFQFICNYTGITSTNWNKIAVKYKANDFAVWVNGTEVFTDAIGSCPSASTFTDLAFGAASTGATPFLGQVQELMLFPTALVDAELLALTTL